MTPTANTSSLDSGNVLFENVSSFTRTWNDFDVEYLVVPFWPVTAWITQLLPMRLTIIVRVFAQLLCRIPTLVNAKRNTLRGAPVAQPWWPKKVQPIPDELPLLTLGILGRNLGLALAMAIEVVEYHRKTSFYDIIIIYSKSGELRRDKHL